jgi:predicted MFS family arabinose efflux permease
MIPSVVSRDQLERANSWLGAGTSLMQGMAAGPLGGLLFTLTVSAPFFVNATTYAVSAALIGLLPGAYRASHGDGTAWPQGHSTRIEVIEAFRWLAGQRLLRSMAALIGLLNLTLTAAEAVLVLLVKERLQLGSLGYGLLLTCMALGGLIGSSFGERLIKRWTATWVIRAGLLVEAGTHLVLATSSSPDLTGLVLFVFGAHGALWGIVSVSLRQRLTPPEISGKVSSTMLFISVVGNCVGALLGGLIVVNFGLTAPYWIGFVVALAVAALTWRTFDQETLATACVSQ